MDLRLPPYKRPSPYQGLGRMLLISLALHVIVVVIFGVGLLPQKRFDTPPAIRVNLANLPVERPQAGRPDAGSKVKPKEAPKEISAPKPAPAPKPEPKPEPKPVPKVEPKPVAKPKPDPKAVARADEKARAERLKQLQRQRQAEAEQAERDRKIAELKSKLAALGTDSPTPATDAPVGEVTGSGDQKGVSFATAVEATLKGNWKLSKYQLSARDLKAVVKVVISPQGQIVDYSIRGSGNSVFDDSVRNAVLRSKEIAGYVRPRVETYEVEFNLSDLKD